MRRGHPGIGGWRSDSPRHFRPRSGGTPHFRGSRGYGLIDTPRFPHPGPRFQSPGSYNNVSSIDHMSDHHDRGTFRGIRQNNPHRSQDRKPFPRGQGQKQIFPLLQRMRQNDVPDHNNSFNDVPNYFEDTQKSVHVNKMGDIDHRLLNPPSKRESFKPHISPWINPPYCEDRSPPKSYNRHQNKEHNTMTQTEYGSSHRPPASDYYGGHQGSTMDNSNTFSQSVDDTVSIVRKRLLSRDSQHSSENTQINQIEAEKPREPMTSSFANNRQEQISKKKSHNSHRSRNVKLNCDAIKNKIVHQLFVMDKDKIHKLMDNPNSSSKFEYAISSLVTESQNSYNRHLRSAAEKSLCSTSTEFINNDNNKIYEDTFMKQMQCLLDPQDTVLLEDIKPIVLAELCKVLQIDALEQRYEDEASCSRDEQSCFDQFSGERYDYENNYQNHKSYSPVDDGRYCERKPQTRYERSVSPSFGDVRNADFGNQAEAFDTVPLFERRKSRKSKDSQSRRSSSEHRRKERRSMDSKGDANYMRSATPVHLFDGNTEQFSEDDDPFAELDKQYHVAVDHNFIESYEINSPPQSVHSIPDSPIYNTQIKSTVDTPVQPHISQLPNKIDIKTTDMSTHKIKEEIDSQLQDMAKSPLKFSTAVTIKNESNLETLKQNKIKQDLTNSSTTPTKQSENIENKSSENVFNQEQTPEPKSVETIAEKSEISSRMKSSTPSLSRKRSTDQRPSHRKEKRKKSESSQPDTNQQILNKNIIINVNDCAAKSKEKCDTSKSVFNLFFSKNKSTKEPSKDSKKTDTVDKEHSDKHIKRRDSSKKSSAKDKDNDTKKKNDSSSSNHSTVSPLDTNTIQSKADGQAKLKPIDMFGDSQRKASSHHAHRNTATTPATPKAAVQTKPIVLGRIISKRHIATQVLRKCLSKEVQTVESKSCTSRFCQTDRKKLMTRGAQTDPASLKPATKSTDTFERMKEIDMEIQALLQEKFKLYNSLESKESSSSTMQSLGMAVLNVAPGQPNEDANDISEDMIVEEFTNIPEEELEQIALETVQEQKSTASVTEKRRRRLTTKSLETEQNSSQSSSTSTNSTRSKRNTKTPNISLLEQIITDDRPLEDIISLDDFEEPLSKPSKKKTRVQKPKKKALSKKVKVKHVYDLKGYGIKECSVVLIREDMAKMLQRLVSKPAKLETVPETSEEKTDMTATEVEIALNVTDVKPDIITEVPQTVEETIENDLQFDMLDVSEDIVIGDVCEVKSSNEKDTSTLSISEEIILDNSQSSLVDTDETLADDDSECQTYDYSADENLRRDCTILTGNGDAVLAIESLEEAFLAACLDGNVYHFNTDGKLLNTLRGSNLAVTCLTVVKDKHGTTVYTGSLDSRIRYYDLERGLEKGPECNVLSPIQSMDRAWDTVFVGTRTGFVLQFECKNNMLIPISTVKFSEQSILALRAIKEGPRKVLLVAARSENVTIKDAQTGLLLRTLEGPKMTVYTLLFEDGKVYCGTSSHQIHVFDYASGSHVHAHESGKGVVCLRAAGGLLFAGCYDGCVYVYREGEPRARAQLRGPSLMLLSLAVVGTKIIAGYKDRSLYIWKIPLAILQEMIL